MGRSRWREAGAVPGADCAGHHRFAARPQSRSARHARVVGPLTARTATRASALRVDKVSSAAAAIRGGPRTSMTSRALTCLLPGASQTCQCQQFSRQDSATARPRSHSSPWPSATECATGESRPPATPPCRAKRSRRCLQLSSWGAPSASMRSRIVSKAASICAGSPLTPSSMWRRRARPSWPSPSDGRLNALIPA